MNHALRDVPKSRDGFSEVVRWRLVSGQTESTGQADSRPLYRKIDVPLFLAGVITGILALSNDAWWTLRGNGSNQIILFRISPFYMETNAIGLPATTVGTT